MIASQVWLQLGFRLPKVQDPLIYIKQQNLSNKTEIQKEAENQFDAEQFIQKINHKSMKPSTKIDIDSQVELAFFTYFLYFRSFDPKRIVLSDADSNNQKNFEILFSKAENVPQKEEELEGVEKSEIGPDRVHFLIQEYFHHDEDGNLQLYCRIDCKFNRRYLENGDFMIKCDNSSCDQWFHPACIGMKDISAEQANSIQFYCSNQCKQEKRYNTGSRVHNKKKIKYY